MRDNSKKRKDRRGFTLVELIVVLVILAILAALLVPALTGYIDRAREKSAISECRQVVVAAQTELSQLYAKDSKTGDSLQAGLNKLQAEILSLSEVTGKINGSILADEKGSIVKLVYEAKNGTKVIYERDADPQYYIDKNGSAYSKDAPGYLKQLEDVDYSDDYFLDENGKIKPEYSDLFNNASSLGNTSKKAQVVYKDKYGDFPQVSWDEVPYPEGLKVEDTISKNAVWKPIVSKEGKSVIVATSSKNYGNAMAYVVYYDGAYYYHTNGYNKADSKYISDTDFSVDNLQDSGWVKAVK